jgi:hypothetical protein
LSFESNMGSYPKGSDEMEHLRKAFDAAARLTQMVPSEDARGSYSDSAMRVGEQSVSSFLNRL